MTCEGLSAGGSRRRSSARTTRSPARFRDAVLVAVALMISGCAGAGGAAMCEAAGGTYASGTCSRWNAELEAAKQRCETRGGVFLAGQDRCAFGMGGP